MYMLQLHFAVLQLTLLKTSLNVIYKASELLKGKKTTNIKGAFIGFQIRSV